MKIHQEIYLPSEAASIAVLALIGLIVHGCSTRNSDQAEQGSGSSRQVREIDIAGVVSLPEMLEFNPYEEEHLWAWNTDPVKKDTPFLLEEDQPYHELYRSLASKPGFAMISRQIRSDSGELAAQYRSALLLVVAPTPFNAFTKAFAAAGFFNDSGGVLYASELGNPEIRREELPSTISRLTKDVALMRPRSQEEIGSGSGYTAFIAMVINGEPQSFIARRVVPYHTTDPSPLPSMIAGRYRAWQLTDSLIWGIVGIMDSTVKLKGGGADNR